MKTERGAVRQNERRVDWEGGGEEESDVSCLGKTENCVKMGDTD